MDFKNMGVLALSIWFFVSIFLLVIENFLFFLFLRKKGVRASFFFSGVPGYLDTRRIGSEQLQIAIQNRKKIRRYIQVNALISILVFGSIIVLVD